MKKKHKKLTLIIVLVFITYALTTGGVVFQFGKSFDGEISFEGELDLYGSIYIPQVGNQTGIPFIGWVVTSNLPYYLWMHASNSTSDIDRVKIESVEVKYSGGESVKHRIEWEKELEESTVYNPEDSQEKCTTYVLSEYIPVKITKYEDCIIQVKGFYLHGNGTTFPFEHSGSFKFEETYQLSTLWREFPLSFFF